MDEKELRPIILNMIDKHGETEARERILIGDYPLAIKEQALDIIDGKSSDREAAMAVEGDISDMGGFG